MRTRDTSLGNGILVCRYRANSCEYGSAEWGVVRVRVVSKVDKINVMNREKEKSDTFVNRVILSLFNSHDHKNFKNIPGMFIAKILMSLTRFATKKRD